MTRWLRIAEKVAAQGHHPQHKLGAVIVRGGTVLASAANYLDASRRRHAEERAINNRNGRDFTGATLYCVRLHGTMSKPCPSCMTAIVKAGIRKVVYVDWAGKPQVIKVGQEAA